MAETDYMRYRGKCKEMAETLCKEDSSLTLVRGWYHEPYWKEKQAHWWCRKPDGTIVDPTRLQFPSGGIPDFYEEFDGNIECSNCGKLGTEDTMHFESRYAFCSYECHGRFVGVL